MEKKQVKLSVIGFAILLFGLIGVTYAFFNYTKTGNTNAVRTGRIYFNTTEGISLNITNMFPMTSTEAGNANLDSLTIGIVGDTTYADGEEFLISITGVNNTVNNKQIPINYIATYTAANGGSIGTSNDDYYSARNSKNANIYKLQSTGQIENGKKVLVGYIKNGATGISGTLTIKAYVDANRIAITDTPEENSDWIRDRTVFSTTEWNSFSSSALSFQIKAESNEGIWVPGEIASCQGCKYLYTTNEIYPLGNNANQVPTVLTTGLSDNYQEIMTNSGKNVFIGVILNSSNQVTNSFACGVRGNVPFCLEGTLDGSKYTANQTLLQSSSLWNNTCTVTNTRTRCLDTSPNFDVSAEDGGGVYVVAGDGWDGFFVDGTDGRIYYGALD